MGYSFETRCLQSGLHHRGLCTGQYVCVAASSRMTSFGSALVAALLRLAAGAVSMLATILLSPLDRLCHLDSSRCSMSDLELGMFRASSKPSSAALASGPMNTWSRLVSGMFVPRVGIGGKDQVNPPQRLRHTSACFAKHSLFVGIGQRIHCGRPARPSHKLGQRSDNEHNNRPRSLG